MLNKEDYPAGASSFPSHISQHILIVYLLNVLPLVLGVYSVCVKSISRDGKRFVLHTSSLEGNSALGLKKPFDLMISFLGINSEQITSNADKDICTKMFFAELFIKWKK